MIIEEKIISHLINAAIDGIGDNVYCGVPEYPPDAYILIERTAGSETNYLRSCMIAVQSISASSPLEAAQINEDVLDAMDTLAQETANIYSCRLNSNYNFTNTATKEYRYQAVFDINYQKEV